MMNTLGNILWLVLGGLMVAVEYFIAGLLLCLTIVGIPFGFQAMKIGVLALWPFVYTSIPMARSNGFLHFGQFITFLPKETQSIFNYQVQILK